MMVEALNKKDVVVIKLIKRRRATVAFKGACLLIALLLWSFYRDVLFPVQDRTTYSTISILIIMYLPKMLVTAYLCYRLIAKIDNKPINNVSVLLVAFIFTVMLSYVVARSGGANMLDLLLVIVGLLFFNHFSFSKKETVKVIWLLIITIGLILLHASPIDGYVLGVTEKFNPNEAAYCLTMLFCVLITFFVKYKKVIYLLIAIGCVCLQFVYGSRTSFFGLLLFGFLLVLFRARRKTFKFKTVFVAILFLALFGVLFAYYYSVVLFEKYGKHAIYIFGKDLFTGRETIWQLAFESIKANLWFGVGSHLNEEFYTTGSVIMNAHNQSVGVLGAFGVFVFISFYLSIAYIVADQYKRKNKNRGLAIFFMLVIIMSFLDLHFFQTKNYSVMLLAYAIISVLSDYHRGGKKCRKVL